MDKKSLREIKSPPKFLIVKIERPNLIKLCFAMLSLGEFSNFSHPIET